MTAAPLAGLDGRAGAAGSFLAVTAGLAALVVLLFAASVLVGPAEIAPAEALRALVDGRDTALGVVMREIRLPRAVLGLLVGGTLGLSGAVLQGLLRNPLAEPGITGISASAALGAVVVFYFGLAAASPLMLPAGGMAGALLAVLLLYGIAGRNAGVLTLILAGVAVNSFAGALIALALNLAPNPFAITEIVQWLMGSLADRSFDHVALAAPAMAVGWALLLSLGRALDALILGEDAARSLGFDMGLVRLRAILGTALAVGAAVAVSGAVGFVGLVVPHLVRPLVGHQPSRILFASLLGGAALTLAADLAARLAPGGFELKLGVVTALIGAPFFLYLVLASRRTEP